MWHSRGPNFACFDALFKIFHRDVSPNVATEINENNVDALAVVKISSHIIIVLNLSGILQAFQVEMIGNKVVAKVAPINGRIGGKMSIEVAGGATKLCREWYL